MAINELINHMHSWLKEEHFENKVYKEKEASFIVATLGPDARERERTLKILPRLQESGEVLKAPADKKNPIVSLQFTSELPFKVKSAKDTASLLHFINNELYLPGFHFDEAEEKIYFRHINYSLISGIDKKVLIGQTGLILLYLDLYMNPIEEVASGKSTFNNIIEEVVKEAKTFLQIPS